MNTLFGRIFITTSLVATFLAISFLYKNKVDNNYSFNNKPVLQSLPKFTLKTLRGDTLSSDQVNTSSVFHLWATWCGPCEAEFPDFLNYAASFKSQPVLFTLVAVKDDVKNIKKWIKKYGPLPSNAKILLDDEGLLMKNLGSLKVPETLVFNKSNLFVKKFIGPQDWANNYYKDNISFLLGL